MNTWLFFLILSSTFLFACGDKPPREQAVDSSAVQEQKEHEELARIPEPDTSGTGRWTANTRSSRHDVIEAALLGDVRTSTSPEYERIVFVFRSASLPNWHIEYIDKPVRSCGSGEVVDLAGHAWLEVRLEPTNAHDTAGHPTIPWRGKKFSYRTLLEMKQTCDFEAVTTFVAGLRSPNKYRVLELKDPTRLVVDIQN
jgi:hypothetical protein